MVPGWIWDPHVEKWEIGFRYLIEFTQREGHCRIPKAYRTSDGYPLGAWAMIQRKTRDVLSMERKNRLESASGWMWDVLAANWSQGHAHLQEFARKEGHCRVPHTYRTLDDFRLGTWVSTQRATRSELSSEKSGLLESVAGWTWDPLADQWEAGLRHLMDFVVREGHCRVPNGFQSSDGFRLSAWVGTQKNKKATMPESRRIRLEAFTDWIWGSK